MHWASGCLWDERLSFDSSKGTGLKRAPLRVCVRNDGTLRGVAVNHELARQQRLGGVVRVLLGPDLLVAAAVGAVVRLAVRRALAELVPLLKDAAALGLALVHVLVVDRVGGPGDVASGGRRSARHLFGRRLRGSRRNGASGRRRLLVPPPALDVAAAVLAFFVLALARALVELVRLDVHATTLRLATVHVFVVDGALGPGDVGPVPGSRLSQLQHDAGAAGSLGLRSFRGVHFRLRHGGHLFLGGAHPVAASENGLKRAARSFSVER